MNPYKDDYSACAVKIGKEILFNGGGPGRNRGLGTYGPSEKTNSTIYTNDGKTFNDLPPMPSYLASHCMVALDGDNLFVTGGFIDFNTKDDSNKSFPYHSDTMEWEEVPDLPTPRAYLLCGMVHNANGEQEVIAAGGFDYGEGAQRAFLFS